MLSQAFRRLFPRPAPIIGMIHVFEGPPEKQEALAIRDLAMMEHSVDGVIVENYGWGGQDSLRATDLARDRLLGLARAVAARADSSGVRVGVNLLPNDFEYALDLTHQAGASFVQLDHVTGQFVGDESVDPTKYRQHRRAHPGIVVLGGVHPKYYQLRNPNTPIGQSARVAMELCDAIVVTGTATGQETSLDDLRAVRSAVGDFPILVGSGLNIDNLREQLVVADGAIVGSAFKPGGVQPGSLLNLANITEFMAAVRTVRAASSPPRGS